MTTFTTPCGHKEFDSFRDAQKYLRSHPRVRGLRSYMWSHGAMVLTVFCRRYYFSL